MDTRTVFETSDSFRADLAEALLKSNGIPYERQNFGAGTHMVMVFGKSGASGIRIIVPEDCADEASSALEAAGFYQ